MLYLFNHLTISHICSTGVRQASLSVDQARRWILADGRDSKDVVGSKDLSLSRLGQLMTQHGPKNVKAKVAARRVVQRSEIQLVYDGTQQFLRLRVDPGGQKLAGIQARHRISDSFRTGAKSSWHVSLPQRPLPWRCAP